MSWVVYPAGAGINGRHANGDYWLVDGRYYPKTQPGAISVIDMMIRIPKNGTQPKPCGALSN